MVLGCTLGLVAMDFGAPVQEPFGRCTEGPWGGVGPALGAKGL